MAHSPHRRVTQADVARLANVSRSTVSLVINGKANEIPETTRRRVLQAVKELGYAPNVAARMLAQGSNRLIGVFTYQRLFPYETHDFFYPYLLGIERQAAQEDYNLLLFTRAARGDRRSIYQDGVNVLGMTDGAILMGSRTNREELRKLAEEGRPFVYIGRRTVPGCDFDWVTSDYRTASFEATELLLSYGHRRLAFIGLSSTEEPYYDRLEGTMAAVRAHPGARVEVMPDHLLQDGRAMFDFLRESAATALVCTGTALLATVLRQLKPYGVRVPENLSAVAVSDEAASFDPPLQPTHVNLNSVTVGAQAVKLLVERLEGGRTEPKHVTVPCRLVLGNSVQPPSS